MIPKVIHYCWLSNDPFPKKIRRCMASWRKVMPQYELKCWNLENFDIAAAPAYVQEAVKARKWAFAADYIRMYALYTEGGFYFDSDVLVTKPFDEFLGYDFVSSLEYHPSQIERDGAMAMIDGNGNRIADGYVSGIQIQAAVMGAQAGCQFLKEILDWDAAAGRHFVNPDGSLATQLLSPQIYARLAERYGFKYLDCDQELAGNMKVYRSEVFAGNKHEVTPASYAIHYCAHSWHPSLTEKLDKLFKNLFKFLRK